MTRERLIDILENTPADPDPYNAVIDAMVKAVNEALDEAAEESRVKMIDLEYSKPDGVYMNRDGYAYQVNKKSILKLKIQ